MKVAERETKKPSRRTSKRSCADCFFHQQGLCALELDGPCATFREPGPTGLVPPRQSTLLVREAALAA